ncbi:MAG TPA: hypothetical protein VMI54_14300 [Polyangiaceae bacterium]|nr:hypothetical protein [Polyangiaceae bacterium]
MRWLLPTCLLAAATGCGNARPTSVAGASHDGGAPSATPGAGGVGGAAAGFFSGGGLASGGRSTGVSGDGSAAAGTTGGSLVYGGSSGGGSVGAAGASGTAGTGGSPAAAGSSSEGGAPGGMGGAAASGGAGAATGTPDICSFQISGSLSTDIPTVGLVDWSTDLAGITAARIEFSLDDPRDGELNVGSGGPISVSDSRALLLGLKPGRSYTYRIVATAGATTCVSPDQALTTSDAGLPPAVTRDAGALAASRANGFILACGYSGGEAVIVDTDGDIVWWTAVDFDCSREQMDWDGASMWLLDANPTDDGQGGVRRVRMDGSGMETIAGLELAHHDFAVLPGGTTAFLFWTNASDESSDLVERSADGTLQTLARLDASTFGTTTSRYHTNALRYYASNDSYSVTDISLYGVFELNRAGQLLERASGFEGIHGHELLPNGNLLYFQAYNGTTASSGPSPVYEYALNDQAGQITPNLVWTYVGEDDQLSSFVLGDVQRLDSGNTLLTYSTGEMIREVTPAGDVVQTLTFPNQIGYTTFRKTLYGPPQ